MNEREYQKTVLGLANPELSDTMRLVNWGLGLAGEAGEIFDMLDHQVLEIVYTQSYHEFIDKTKKIIGEMGDWRWYFTAMYSELNLNGAGIVNKSVEMPSGRIDPFRLSKNLMKVSCRIADLVKKITCHGHTLDQHRTQIANMLVEGFEMYMLLCLALGYTDGNVKDYNIKKLTARYEGTKFSTSHSINRIHEIDSDDLEELNAKDFSDEPHKIIDALIPRPEPMIDTKLLRASNEKDVEDRRRRAGLEPESFQKRELKWVLAMAGKERTNNKTIRNHRFLEEALELVQACGCTKEEALGLTQWVFSKPAGRPEQEVGGVMTTLASLSTVHEINMEQAGEKELARMWTNIDSIRAKHYAKPTFQNLSNSVTTKNGGLVTVPIMDVLNTMQQLFPDGRRFEAEGPTCSVSVWLPPDKVGREFCGTTFAEALEKAEQFSTSRDIQENNGKLNYVYLSGREPVTQIDWTKVELREDTPETPPSSTPEEPDYRSRW